MIDYRTIYDTPGFGDSRGVEVSLANALAIKELKKVTKSAKFVMTYERSLIDSLVGTLWRARLKNLKESFGDILISDPKNLLLVITKLHNDDDLETVKQEIKKQSGDFPDLSEFAMVYNPLDGSQDVYNQYSKSNDILNRINSLRFLLKVEFL